MCWVAFDRAIRLAGKRSLAGPTEKWQEIRDTIYEDIFTNFWSEDLKSFVQYRRLEDARCICATDASDALYQPHGPPLALDLGSQSRRTSRRTHWSIGMTMSVRPSMV